MAIDPQNNQVKEDLTKKFIRAIRTGDEKTVEDCIKKGVDLFSYNKELTVDKSFPPFPGWDSIPGAIGGTGSPILEAFACPLEKSEKIFAMIISSAPKVMEFPLYTELLKGLGEKLERKDYEFSGSRAFFPAEAASFLSDSMESSLTLNNPALLDRIFYECVTKYKGTDWQRVRENFKAFCHAWILQDLNIEDMYISCYKDKDFEGPDRDYDLGQSLANENLKILDYLEKTIKGENGRFLASNLKGLMWLDSDTQEYGYSGEGKELKEKLDAAISYAQELRDDIISYSNRLTAEVVEGLMGIQPRGVAHLVADYAAPLMFSHEGKDSAAGLLEKKADEQAALENPPEQTKAKVKGLDEPAEDEKPSHTPPSQ